MATKRQAYLDRSPQALVQADLWLVSQHSTGLLNVVPTVCTCERHAETRKGRLAPGQPAPPLGQCRDCKTDQLGQHDGVTRGVRVGREHAPHSPREIPKVEWLAVRDEERLAGDVEWVFAGANESWLGELVKTRANDRLLGLVWTLKGSDDSIAPLGTLDVRTQWPCERRGHTLFAGSQVDRWQGGIQGPGDHFRRAGRLRDELISCEEMSIDNVADIGPVEEVGVVANLEVSAALFEDAGEVWDVLAVTRSGGEIVNAVIPSPGVATYPKMPAGRRATVSKPSVPLAASTSSSPIALDSL